MFVDDPKTQRRYNSSLTAYEPCVILAPTGVTVVGTVDELVFAASAVQSGAYGPKHGSDTSSKARVSAPLN